MTVPNGGASILEVRDLRTYFFMDEGTVKAVDGVSFEVHAGRTLGIVGESGCGKSVTAKSILRIVERPGRIVGGEIRLRPGNAGNGLLPAGDGVAPSEPRWSAPQAQGRTAGVDLAQLDPASPELRHVRGGEIGLVFQEPMASFSPVHTVGNQMLETIRTHARTGKVAAREQAVEMLRLVGVPRPERRIDEYAFQLSGGLRQRAMIALALCCHPRILLADEPTTALDVTTQAQILDLLRRLQAERGMAIVLITHNLGVVAEMCDEVAVMYLGRIVERGPVDAIFHAPKHPYTRALLRSIPSVRAASRTRLATIAGSVPHPYARPSGCPFHPRCPDAMPGVCDHAEPAARRVGEDQDASCFLYEAAR